MTLDPARARLVALLEAHEATDDQELRDVAFILDFVRRHPDCFLRSCQAGHITGSAFIVDPRGERLLLLHHHKLDRWLQPGGHGEPTELEPAATALREAREETGLRTLRQVVPVPLDIDVHVIPARGSEPQHPHLDVRYLFVAEQPDELERCLVETRDLRWFSWQELEGLGVDAAFLRAARKARALARGWLT